MSETKTAFAEKAIQSFKNMIYRYIEEHGEKLMSNSNCLKNRSVEKPPRYVINIDFSSTSYNQNENF